ncbi:MAG: type II and III secretion system protein family protein [Salinisphaera sp.]|nr:type II and III secretion system protein family protein [Salinisphaera sp.]
MGKQAASMVLAALGMLLYASATLAGPVADTVQVGVGQQRIVHVDQRIERVALGNPEVAGINVLGTHEIMLTGKKRGDTSLLVWPAQADKPLRFALVVASGDLPKVLLAAPRAEVITQVQTDILIAEVARSAIRKLGFNFVNAEKGANILRVSPPGVSGGAENVGSGLNLLSNTGFQPIGDAFNLLFADEDGDFFSFLSVLERRGLMRTLARPSLVAMSGQTATFLAGGEFPIPVVQSGSSNGAITIEFKEFGIRLSLTPTVLANDRIALRVAPEVSELDYTAGVTVQGIRVPGVRVRRTDTMVRLGDGESFIISGLVDSDMAAFVDKVPWLGDIPIIGTFFRSTSYQRKERELIMVVTPHLVTPLAPETDIPIPGEQYDHYTPSAADQFFFETGDFGQRNTGFTR